MALSFDGTPLTYEYAVNFFNTQKQGYYVDSSHPAIPQSSAGLYNVTEWNTNVYTGYTASNPFAMQTGTLVETLTSNTSADELTFSNERSYYRIVELDLTTLGLENKGFTLGAHWTMSCGNDAVNGKDTVAPVPEPATMLLFGTGIAGLAGMIRRRRAHN